MAYAAVISLKNTIYRLNIFINIPQIIKPAYEELDSLLSVLNRLDDRSSRSIDRSVINQLDAKIRDEVWKLEDVLESYVLYQELDQKGLVQEINSFLKTVRLLREEYNRVLLQKPLPGEEDEAVAVSVPVNKSMTVGLSDLTQNIINEVLGWEVELTTVSLVGMAGIGKTHLATLIYHHPLIVEHFHSRMWIKIGPKDQTNNILVDIIVQIESKPRDLFKGKRESALRDIFLNGLNSSRRYLIVLDDIWTTQTLDYFRNLLPDYGNCSRILLTTRLQKVAQYYLKTKTRLIPFLNNEESWNLLWQNVFVGVNTFPYQLEKPGRKIAENCEGLPLLILTVANILRGLDKTEEYWEKVAEKKTTTFTDAYDQIYELLLPNYEFLPQRLKPCFLYMGVFPQSCQIPLTKLIYYWTIEDIFEPSLYQTLEGFGMDYAEALVSNSLGIVCKRRFHGVRRLKSLKLHSAYWYLCVTEARKNKFFHVLKKLSDVSIERPRRLSVQNNSLLGLNEVYDSMVASASTSRSLLFTGEYHQYPVRICFHIMLLVRVLDALAIRFYEFPNEVLKLLQLRYLSLTHNGGIPSSISKLQQLQCLILRRHHNIKLVHRDSSCLPDEIWDMKELKHLRIMGSNLPDPSEGAELPRLLTLYVNADSCSEAVFRSIPNVKKLGITIELQPEAAETVRCLEHIGILKRLESLKCVVVNHRLRSQLVFAPPNHLPDLPPGLKKLSLNGLGYSWKEINKIYSLTYLKVLKLRCSAFQGPHLETKAGQFSSLEYLLLEDIDLVHWTAQGYLNYNCFQCLRHLIVRHCYKLKKIPLEIGDIPSLEMMEVDDCSPSVVASAHQIKKWNRNSSHFQLVINSSWNE